MKISKKLLLTNSGLLLAAGLSIALVLSLLAVDGLETLTDKGSEAITERAMAQLASLRTTKAGRVENYFETIRRQVEAQASSRTVIDGTLALTEGYRRAPAEWAQLSKAGSRQSERLAAHMQANFLSSPEFPKHAELVPGYRPKAAEAYLPKADAGRLLQSLYIEASGNPNPVGDKHRLDRHAARLSYNEAHAHYHPALRTFLDKFGFYDIFIIEPRDSVIVYSVFKEVDYATSLVLGPYASTNFARSVARSMQAGREGTRGFIALEDFEPYEPSYNAAASFISTPIFDGADFIGVLAFQMPVQEIARLMTFDGKWAAAGLGESGETYLVGADLLLRSPSRFGDGDDLLLEKVDTAATRAALGGATNQAVITDYRGKEVLSAYQPLAIPGLRYALLAEIDLSEAMAARTELQNAAATTASRMRRTTILSVLLVLLVAAGLTTVFVRSLVRPLQRISEEVTAIARHRDLSSRVTVQTEDEVGELAGSLNQFIETIHSSVREVAQMTASVGDGAQQMRQTATGLDEVSGALRAQATPMGGALQEVSASIQSMATTAEQASTNVRTVSSETERMSQLLESVSSQSEQSAQALSSVSAAVDQMSSSIQEIASQTARAAQIAQSATSTATDANRDIASLDDAAKEIYAVVDLITTIADRTKLLALNATIEAAGAGEAGRGFAVVAGEVKALAHQTAEATEGIRARIEAIQSGTRGAMDGVQNMASVLDELSGITMTIASAVEQQSAAVQEVNHSTRSSVERNEQIHTSVTSAAEGVARVAREVDELASGASVQAEGTVKTAEAADHINHGMDRVNLATEDTVRASGEVASIAELLGESSAALQVVVGRFQLRARQ